MVHSGTMGVFCFLGERGTHDLNFLANYYSQFPLLVWPNRLIKYLKQRSIVYAFGATLLPLSKGPDAACSVSNSWKVSPPSGRQTK